MADLIERLRARYEAGHFPNCKEGRDCTCVPAWMLVSDAANEIEALRIRLAEVEKENAEVVSRVRDDYANLVRENIANFTRAETAEAELAALKLPREPKPHPYDTDENIGSIEPNEGWVDHKRSTYAQSKHSK